MSRVNVDVLSFSDIRFQKIAVKVGLDKYSVRGRFEEVWLHCTVNETYTVSKEDFESIITVPGFFDAALEVKLLKPFRETFYVSGTRGRIEWYGKLKRLSRRGGEANRKRIREKDKENNVVIKNKNESRTDSLPASQKGSPKDSPLIQYSTIQYSNKKNIYTTPLVGVESKVNESKGEVEFKLNKSKGQESNLNSTFPQLCSSTENSPSPARQNLVKARKEKSDGAKLFDYYSEKIEIRRQFKAFPSAKVYTLCKNLVDEVGLEISKKMVDKYLSDSTNEFLVANAFKFEYLYNDRQKYHALGVKQYAEVERDRIGASKPWMKNPMDMTPEEYEKYHALPKTDWDAIKRVTEKINAGRGGI